MSELIYHQLHAELKGWHAGELALERVWNDFRSRQPYDSLSAADHPDQEPGMSVIDTLKSDLEHVLEGHKNDIEDGLTVAAKVAENPLAQTVLGLGHVPPSLLSKIGDWLTEADAEFAKLAPPAPAPEPAPETPAEPAPAADPQPQTGMAV